MSRVTVAVDPGVATGVAVWNDGEQGLDMDLTGEYDTNEFYHFLRATGPVISHMRIEQFTITQATARKSRVMEPIWNTGACKYVAWLYKFDISWSKPADVMRRFPDKALKQAGWYHSSEHARDAMRHLAAHLIQTKAIDARGFLL